MLVLATMDSVHEVRKKQVTQDVARLYEQHADALKRYVRARVESSDDAEDIIQDVFVEMCRGDVIGRAKTNPEAYLLGIARHLVAGHVRKKQRERQARKGVASVLPETSTDASTPGKDIEKIVALLECLSPLDRQALKLRYLQGVTPKEAAAQLGCTPHVFHSRLYRAIKAFHRLVPESERI